MLHYIYYMLFQNFCLDLFILSNSFGNRSTRIKEQIEIGRIVDLCQKLKFRRENLSKKFPFKFHQWKISSKII